MYEPVIVDAIRTPIGKADKGSLVNYRPDDLGAIVLKSLVKKLPPLLKEKIDDIIFGCAMPEAEQGLNVANISKFIAGLPHTVSAMTINRFCSSGLQAIAIANDAITVGRNKIAIAGGVESMSMVPLGGHKVSPHPGLIETNPNVYLGMGLTAENVAEHYNISREEQDRFAYESNMKAAKAFEDGKFKDEIVPLEFETVSLDKNFKIKKQQIVLNKDECVRPDTDLQSLSTLNPVFKRDGNVTAASSSKTADGAAAIMLMEKQDSLQFDMKPMARLIAYANVGVQPEIMGIGPIYAIPKALKLANLELSDIGLFEINEAFASQCLAVIKTLKIDKEKVNVNGGALAMGHPLGATGAILTVKIIYEMQRRNIKYGIVSLCVGGGMGVAGIFENMQQ